MALAATTVFRADPLVPIVNVLGMVVVLPDTPTVTLDELSEVKILPPARFEIEKAVPLGLADIEKEEVPP